jgi:hypothetical protein
MQSGDWIALFHRIPRGEHDNLAVTTIAGVEIAVQTILRVEPAYVLVRGRQTGVTDCGGFFFVPYAQILFLGFQKPVNEAVLRAMYGERRADEALATAPPPSPVEPAAAAEVSAPPAPAQPAAPAATAPAAPAANKSGVMNKAALLERLRSRRSEPGAQPSRP